MNIENIGEELSNLVEKFELTKTCLHLAENQEKLSSLMKQRESLSFWNNLDYAMQTNKEIKSLQELFNEVQTLQNRITEIIKTVKVLVDHEICMLKNIFIRIVFINIILIRITA